MDVQRWKPNEKINKWFMEKDVNDKETTERGKQKRTSDEVRRS